MKMIRTFICLKFLIDVSCFTFQIVHAISSDFLLLCKINVPLLLVFLDVIQELSTKFNEFTF